MLEQDVDKLHHTIQTLQQQIHSLTNENYNLRLKKFAHFNNEDCWIYQEDGGNNLESLVCPVIIKPETLLKLLGSHEEYLKHWLESQNPIAKVGDNGSLAPTLHGLFGALHKGVMLISNKLPEDK